MGMRAQRIHAEKRPDPHSKPAAGVRTENAQAVPDRNVLLARFCDECWSAAIEIRDFELIPCPALLFTRFTGPLPHLFHAGRRIVEIP